jgi:protein-tyrosine phosphatase
MIVFFLRKFDNEEILSDFSFSFCSFVEFLKQIERIHVFFCYSFIVFLWSVFLFNQIVNDFFADFFLQDFLYFVDFVVIEKLKRRIFWYDAVVFSSFVRFQVKDMKYIMNAIKRKKNQAINLLIHCFDDRKWF